MTPTEQNRNLLNELIECANILAFLTEATISMLGSSDNYCEQITLGAQASFFHLQDRMSSLVTAVEGSKNDF